MPSSYSTDLKLELMVTGENNNTWGDKTNNNWNLIQQAVAGYQSVALTSTTTTLAMVNATISNARNMMLELTGTLTGNSNIVIPDGLEKLYFIKDSTTHGAYTLTFKTTTGAGFALTQGKITGAYCNGSNAFPISLDNLGGSMTIDQVLNYGNSTNLGLTVGDLTAINNISTSTLSVGTILSSPNITCTTLVAQSNNDLTGNLRAVPVIPSGNVGLTLSAASKGQCISIAANVTVPSGVFFAGENAVIYNYGTANISIIEGGGATLYQAGTGNVGNRSLSTKGIATVYCVSTNTFIITGAGLT